MRGDAQRVEPRCRATEAATRGGVLHRVSLSPPKGVGAADRFVKSSQLNELARLIHGIAGIRWRASRKSLIMFRDWVPRPTHPRRRRHHTLDVGVARGAQHAYHTLDGRNIHRASVQHGTPVQYSLGKYPDFERLLNVRPALDWQGVPVFGWLQ